MKTIKILIISLLLINPVIGFSQNNEMSGKWKFNAELIQQECANWIKAKTIELDSLEGEKKAALLKELKMVKQMESSLHFSFTGLLYDFKTDTTLIVVSTQGNVSTKLEYKAIGESFELKYPQIESPFVYRYEFKDGKLIIYEIVNGIERFGQILEKI